MPQPTEPRPVLTWEEDVGAAAVHDEVRALGYRGSYPSFPRALRTRGLRPRCEACAGVTGRETVEIAHPPGEETQWDWVELPGAPWGGVRTCWSGRCRTRARPGRCWPRPRTCRTWSRRWT